MLPVLYAAGKTGNVIMNIVLRIVTAVAALVLAAGCETESSDQISISISPNNATVKKGESREFTASGWQDYTWSLSDPKIGVLSATKGDSTTYTAVKGPASTNETLSQILVLSVGIASDNASPSTNATPGSTENITAQALITQTYAP